MIKAIREWSQRQARLAAVIVGLLLAFLPTFFTLFSPQRIPRWGRIAILVVWLLGSAIVIAGAARKDEHVMRIAEDRSRTVRRARLSARNDILTSLLQPGARGIPASYEFTVYTADDDLLVPIYPQQSAPGGVDHRIFKRGCGATGRAWAEEETVYVQGELVHNDEYNLTSEQQELFKEYSAVIAVPIPSPTEGHLGVLTALSRIDDDFFTEIGRTDSLRILADTIGVVLVTMPARRV